MYERIWDESDYVIPPSENNAFFVMTNVVMTANQTRTTCPEDPTEIPDVICGYVNETSGQVNITEGVCGQGEVFNLIKSHGNKQSRPEGPRDRRFLKKRAHFFILMFS